MHAIAAQVEVSMVKGKLDQETGKLMKATFLKAGEKGVCLINVRLPTCRLNARFVWKSTNSCLAWVDSLFVIRESSS